MAYYRINDISISGNTIQNVNTNGNIVLLPNGTGIIDTTTLQFDQLSLNNLSSATGVGSNDIFIVVSNPTGTSDTLKITGTTLRSSLLNQPAQLQFRQGLESERLLVTPATGEPIWITDTKRLFIGDGSTVGGIGVSMSGHTHLASDITNFNSGVSGLVSGIYAPLTGTLNQFASTSSSQLASIISDETGSGLLVFNNSPTLTGMPLTPTATSGTNTNQIASTAFVRTEISNLVSAAPSTLDTLNELASALGNDPNFATTVTNTLATKVSATGTANYIPKFTAAQIVGNSIIFDNGTNVGISNTNPAYKLDTSGVIRSSSYITSDTEFRLNNQAFSRVASVDPNGGFAGGYNIYLSGLISKHNSLGAIAGVHYYSDGSIRFFSNSSQQANTDAIERMRITNNGNIGIGTGTQATSPPERLVVEGNLRLADTTGSIGNRLQLARSGGSAYDYSLSKESNHLAISTATDAANTRAVQIGYHSGTVWSPKIHLNGYTGAVGVNNTFASLQSSMLIVRGSGSTSSTSAVNVINSSNSSILFARDDGNIGIGIAAPSGKLHVLGSGIFSTTGTVVPNALLSVYSSISGDNVFNVEGRNGSLFSVIDNLSGSLMSVNNNAGLPVFEVFSDDRIVGGRFGQNDWVVSSGGNVGIGTGVPAFKLHVIGTGNFTQNLLVNGTGVSISGHTHTVANITDFNSSISGLLPTISNSGDNRILTSTGSSFGINAENNATFDGTNFNITGILNIDNLRIDGSTISSTNTNGNILIMPSGSGNVGINTLTPTYKLEVNGSLSATTKSFKIQHPSKDSGTLEYGSLESPYHGVRLTGKDELQNGVCVVTLPDYIKDLVHPEENINIQLTNYKHSKTLYVDNINIDQNKFTVKGYRCKTLKDIQFFWTFTGIRKDIDLLQVEK